MAPWPSGKARVCKTLIPGPIPGGASKTNHPNMGAFFVLEALPPSTDSTGEACGIRSALPAQSASSLLVSGKPSNIRPAGQGEIPAPQQGCFFRFGGATSFGRLHRRSLRNPVRIAGAERVKLACKRQAEQYSPCRAGRNSGTPTGVLF